VKRLVFIPQQVITVDDGKSSTNFHPENITGQNVKPVRDWLRAKVENQINEHPPGTCSICDGKRNGKDL
jgi:hypothetical protein